MKRAINGDIWEAKELTVVEHHNFKKEKTRRVVIEKGERVEFRFWSPAVFRTMDNLYLELSEKDFHEKFRYAGRIFEEVYRRNQNSTKEILDGKLYSEDSNEDSNSSRT